MDRNSHMNFANLSNLGNKSVICSSSVWFWDNYKYLYKFWPIWENSKIYVGIAVHKQCSLLTQYLTIFFILDLQENIYKQIEKTDYPGPASAALG